MNFISFFERDNPYSFIFVVLLILAQLLGIFLNTFTVKIRKNRTELNNIWSREMVRIIMSKMEILQAKKIQLEVQKLHDIHEKQIGYNLKMAPYLNTFSSDELIFKLPLFPLKYL